MSPRVTDPAELPGAFAYEHTDVPPAMTLTSWRRQRDLARRHRSRYAWARLLARRVLRQSRRPPRAS